MATLGTLLAPDLLDAQSCWRLRSTVNGYSRATGTGLATQANAGRSFRILKIVGSRLQVMLLDDGYPCWIDKNAVIGKAELHIVSEMYEEKQRKGFQPIEGNRYYKHNNVQRKITSQTMFVIELRSITNTTPNRRRKEVRFPELIQ